MSTSFAPLRDVCALRIILPTHDPFPRSSAATLGSTPLEAELVTSDLLARLGEELGRSTALWSPTYHRYNS